MLELLRRSGRGQSTRPHRELRIDLAPPVDLTDMPYDPYKRNTVNTADAHPSTGR
jgi:hypothetical protein